MSDAPRAPLRINVVTIFPAFFEGPLSLSIPARARAAGGVEYRLVDLRDFTHDRHRTVASMIASAAGSPPLSTKSPSDSSSVASPSATRWSTSL